MNTCKLDMKSNSGHVENRMLKPSLPGAPQLLIVLGPNHLENVVETLNE